MLTAAVWCGTPFHIVCNLLHLQVRVNLWDLAGPTEYIEVRNEFYKDAQGSILVYDVTNRASFEALELWLDESKRFGATDMIVFVAATKVDQQGRKVQEREGREWAAGQGVPYFEVSRLVRIGAGASV
eukprot:jgi/Chrzof1/2302/Cz11g10080.t1